MEPSAHPRKKPNDEYFDCGRRIPQRCIFALFGDSASFLTTSDLRAKPCSELNPHKKLISEQYHLNENTKQHQNNKNTDFSKSSENFVDLDKKKSYERYV